MVFDAPDPQPGSSDYWFAALDQYLIGTGADRWRAHVLGIHEKGDELWIQIAAEGRPDCDLVIHCWRWQLVEDVLRGLQRADRNSAGPRTVKERHLA
jgi:hypothetical protein